MQIRIMFMNNTKKDFLLGLFAGIAVISIIGFLIMTVAYFQKSSVSVKEEVKGAEENNIVQKDNAPAQDDQPAAPAGNSDAVKVNSNDHIRGDKNAAVTIIEFSDLQCPYCSRFHATMKQVMENYGSKVKWVFKHFPLESTHPYARKAAEATECAGEQGKFWEYTDMVYENQASLSDEFLSELADQLKLNGDKFKICLSSGKYAGKVTADLKMGTDAGVRGTPASFINGELVSGALPFENIKTKIDSLLK